MSRFAVSYACRNFSRLCRSDTGSPDETSVRPSLPRMLTSPLVSPPRSAATNACVAASVDSKRLAFITAGLAAAAGAGRRLRAAISEAACGLLADRALLRSTSLLTEPALLADRTLAGACTLLAESALRRAATEGLARLRVRGPGLVEALLRGGVAVLHTLAMRGVVLPLAPALPARAGAPLAVVVLDAVSSLVPVVHVVREVVRGA